MLVDPPAPSIHVARSATPVTTSLGGLLRVGFVLLRALRDEETRPRRPTRSPRGGLQEANRERREAEGRVLGPAPAALSRLKGEHRVQFFVKGAHRAAMRQALLSALATRPDIRRRTIVDVDPMSVL